MVIPEVNPEHLDIIASQRKRLGTKKGIYCCQVELLDSELCSGTLSAAEVWHQAGSGLHLSGNFRSRQDLPDLAGNG